MVRPKSHGLWEESRDTSLCIRKEKFGVECSRKKKGTGRLTTML